MGVVDEQEVELPDGVIDPTLFRLTMAVVAEMHTKVAEHLAQDGYKYASSAAHVQRGSRTAQHQGAASSGAWRQVLAQWRRPGRWSAAFRRPGGRGAGARSWSAPA